MPHYHNFGWYYFAKYVLGLAGMIFLYSGFLKERTVECVCPAEAREHERRKAQNNESCPTGNPIDARAKTDLNLQSHLTVDAAAENARFPQTTRPINPGKSVVTLGKNNPPEYPVDRDRQRRRERFANFSSSDGKVETRNRKRHRPNCRRYLRQRGAGNREFVNHCSTSSPSSRSEVCLRVRKKKNQTGNVLDEIERANVRVRNSFVEQENLEIEAFVRSIVDRRKFTKFSYHQSGISSRTSTSRERIPIRDIIENIDDEKPKNTSSEDNDFSKYRDSSIPPKLPFSTCKKHFPSTEHYSQSPVKYFTPIQSRSGSIYFTASSRGKKIPECKIHGRRYYKSIEDNFNRLSRRARITEQSDESNYEIRNNLRSSVDRRKIGDRRVTRYRSTMIIKL